MRFFFLDQVFLKFLILEVLHPNLLFQRFWGHEGVRLSEVHDFWVLTFGMQLTYFVELCLELFSRCLLLLVQLGLPSQVFLALEMEV